MRHCVLAFTFLQLSCKFVLDVNREGSSEHKQHPMRLKVEIFISENAILKYKLERIYKQR